MKIAVCENSPAAAQQMREWIGRYCELYGLPATVECFLTAERFAGWKERCDIAYIAFGGDAGFLQARLLRERDRACRIILVDDVPVYAVRSVRIHCSDFICRPVQFHHIVRSMRLAMGGGP